MHEVRILSGKPAIIKETRKRGRGEGEREKGVDCEKNLLQGEEHVMSTPKWSVCVDFYGATRYRETSVGGFVHLPVITP